MFVPELVVRRPRPTKLSDPGGDFTPQHLAGLLAKPDDALDGVDYRNLFGPALPAGTCGEIVYFLPLALGYLRRESGDFFEALPAVIGWIDRHPEELAADGLLEPVRATLRAWLDDLVREFAVTHLDETACRAKGRGRAYDDQVLHGPVVADLIAELARGRTLAGLAEEFTAGLARHGGDPVKAAWFLELSRARSEGFRPPRRSPITALLRDRPLLEEAGRVVLEKLVPRGPMPTYWNDTFASLGL